MLAVAVLCLLETKQRIKMCILLYSVLQLGVFPILMNVLNATMAIAQAFWVLSGLVVAFLRNVTLKTAWNKVYGW
jgi:hypothetical protein